MKSIKSLSLLAIGLIAIVVFSFKNAEPVVEYGIVDVGAGACGVIINENVETTPYGKGMMPDKVISKTLNDLSKKGWHVVGIAGSGSQSWHKIYIERIQP